MTKLQTIVTHLGFRTDRRGNAFTELRDQVKMKG